MKEFSIEEKAKRYDEAIEKFDVILNLNTVKESGTIFADDVRKIFPELKESEDEKIRKELIQYLKDYPNLPNGNYCRDDFFAWLEKQGKQKSFDYENANIQQKDFAYIEPDDIIEGSYQHQADDIIDMVTEKSADKVEPKFKVGNWYQCTKDFFGKGVTFDKNTAYYCAKEGCLQCEYGCHIAIVKDLYDNFKLWTIKDAKDCDVLAVENMIFVYKGVLASHIVSYCKLFNNKFECFGDVRTCCAGNSKVHPATKEQRETLLKAMTDAGYTFDFEKKKLKKIEQKPAWSEEDEMIALSIEQVMNCASLLNIVPEKIDKIRTWLKSLKDRYTWKPSGEQIRRLEYFLKLWGKTEDVENTKVFETVKSLLNDLKKIKGE